MPIITADNTVLSTLPEPKTQCCCNVCTGLLTDMSQHAHNEKGIEPTSSAAQCRKDGTDCSVRGIMADGLRHNLTEDQLRQQIAAGSHGAFDLLLRVYRAEVSGLVQRRTPSCDSHEVEDIVQEAFCRLWEHRRRLCGSGSLRSLLWAIVGKVAVDHLRRRRLRVHVPLESEMHSAMPSPEEQVSGRELIQRLQGAMAELTDLQGAAMELRVAGLSTQEIAIQLHCSPKAVECRLASARKHVERRLHMDGPERSGDGT